jgi:hypothetical protein
MRVPGTVVRIRTDEGTVEGLIKLDLLQRMMKKHYVTGDMVLQNNDEFMSALEMFGITPQCFAKHGRHQFAVSKAPLGSDMTLAEVGAMAVMQLGSGMCSKCWGKANLELADPEQKPLPDKRRDGKRSERQGRWVTFYFVSMMIYCGAALVMSLWSGFSNSAPQFGWFPFFLGLAGWINVLVCMAPALRLAKMYKFIEDVTQIINAAELHDVRKEREVSYGESCQKNVHE